MKKTVLITGAAGFIGSHLCDYFISKNYSSRIIDDFFEILIQDLIKSGKIKISSFGTFKVLNKKKRIGRNPKTKIEAIISPRKVIKFVPSSFIKEKLNRQ